MVSNYLFQANEESDTERLGTALAELLPGGSVVSLQGTLGAGKTRLVQAIAAACGVERAQVVSPTFTLCHEYHGRRTIFHFDAYRLKDAAEFTALGIEDYFGQPDSISLVEWGERVMSALPADCLVIEIEVLAGTQRLIQCRATGDFPPAVLDQLAARLR